MTQSPANCQRLTSPVCLGRKSLYCNYCGQELVLQPAGGRLRPTCPSCGRVAYEQLKVGAGVLVEQNGALLLVQRSPQSDAFPGAWNLPAGYCEADEPPRVTAAREAAEETGLPVRVGRLVDAYFFDDDPRGHGVLLVYEGNVEGSTPLPDAWAPQDPGEVAAAGLFLPDRLPALLCGGGHDQAIEAWRRRALDRWTPGMPMRYCPHCTHILEERFAFDRMRLTCPACGFVHFQGPKVGVSVLIERDGQVLLVQRAIDPGRSLWCLPSGFVEWDEAPEAAASRECEEETGLAVTGLELLSAKQYTDDFRGPGINIAYIARAAEGTASPGDDAMAVRWFAPEDLPPRGQIAFNSHAALLMTWRQSLPARSGG